MKDTSIGKAERRGEGLRRCVCGEGVSLTGESYSSSPVISVLCRSRRVVQGLCASLGVLVPVGWEARQEKKPTRRSSIDPWNRSAYAIPTNQQGSECVSDDRKGSPCSDTPGVVGWAGGLLAVLGLPSAVRLEMRVISSRRERDKLLGTGRGDERAMLCTVHKQCRSTIIMEGGKIPDDDGEGDGDDDHQQTSVKGYQ